MTNEQLKRGQELSQLIKTTKEAINTLKEIKPKKSYDNIYYADYVYNLVICEHRDGSGKKADLSRYYGNEKLLNVIIEELEVQLLTYELWYGSL